MSENGFFTSQEEVLLKREGFALGFFDNDRPPYDMARVILDDGVRMTLVAKIQEDYFVKVHTSSHVFNAPSIALDTPSPSRHSSLNEAIKRAKRVIRDLNDGIAANPKLQTWAEISPLEKMTR